MGTEEKGGGARGYGGTQKLGYTSDSGEGGDSGTPEPTSL